MKKKKVVEEKKENTLALFLKSPLTWIFILFLAIVIALVYVKSHGQSQGRFLYYNNYPFYQDKFGFWHVVVRWNNRDVAITFRKAPMELENVSIDNRTYKLFYNPYLKNVYYVFDPDVESVIFSSIFEVAKLTVPQNDIIPKNTIFATSRTTNSSIEKGVPTITCEANASIENLVVHFKINESYNNSIVVEKPNCIFIYATDYNASIDLADRLSYQILRIMP